MAVSNDKRTLNFSPSPDVAPDFHIVLSASVRGAGQAQRNKRLPREAHLSPFYELVHCDALLIDTEPQREEDDLQEIKHARDHSDAQLQSK